MRLRVPSSDDADALAHLFNASEAGTGREALSEHKRIRVLDDRVIDLVALEGGTVVGYAQAAWHGGGSEPHWAIEIVTRPAEPSATWRELLRGIVPLIPRTRVRYVWVTRERELAVAVDDGWRVDRSIHEMHVALPYDIEPVLPDGIDIRPFRPGLDEERWLDVHNASFAGHPEVVETLTQVVKDHLDGPPPPWGDAPPTIELDDLQINQLRALGYGVQ